MTEHQLEYQSPRTYSLQQRATAAILPSAAAGVLKLIWRTTAVETRGIERWREAGACILAFWHEAGSLFACYHNGQDLHTLTSSSFDGELAARLFGRFGFKSLRGSSSRGGLKALNQLTSAARAGLSLTLNVDGSRGPRRVAKPGIGILAIRAGIPIVPQALVARRAWRLNTWDRHAIAKPFTRICCAFGEPIKPPASFSREAVEYLRQSVETSLNTMHASLEAELGVRPVN